MSVGNFALQGLAVSTGSLLVIGCFLVMVVAIIGGFVYYYHVVSDSTLSP